MRFTTFGRGLAILLFALALLRIVTVIAVLQFDDPSTAAARYLGSGTPGSHMDKAFLALFASIALGVLTDISRSVSKLHSK